MVIVFISSYINIFKSYVVYLNIIVYNLFIYSVIYFFKISLAQFILAFVIGVLVICMILTKFTEKDILLHGLILIAVILVIIYME